MELLAGKFIGNFAWLNDVYSVLPNILWAILALTGSAGAVYAIILGINLAKAESEDKRKTAATRMKNTLIGVGVLLLLVLFINIFIPMIVKAAFKDEAWQEIIRLF